jgi:hypothetical protein
MGWDQVQNGALLGQAAKEFGALLTVDQNMKHEQNLTTLPIAVVVLVSVKNTPDALFPFAPFVEQSLPALRLGQMIEIDATGKVTEIAPGRGVPPTE